MLFDKLRQPLHACTNGAVAVVTAIVFPLLLGFTSLGVEVSHWYLGQRQMQGAADAAAVSAAARYIADYQSDPNGTGYQQTGHDYALTNGYTIPNANTCLMKVDGTDNCAPVLALDPRPIICNARPCIVVEITQSTLTWLTTQASFRPTASGAGVQSIPTPTLMARSVVSVSVDTQTATTAGTDCILTLANSPLAVQVRGDNARLRARCGIAIDGGLDQNPGTPILGGITLSGGAKAQINNLVVAANSTPSCPGSDCQKYCAVIPPATDCTPPAPSALTAITFNTATPDPYVAQVAALFQPAPPQGARSATIGANGSGYTNGQRIFTLTGGAKVVAAVSGGSVTGIVGVFDPGAYTSLPTTPVSGSDGSSGTGATFNLTQGCFTWPGTAVGQQPWIPIAGRKYCSIFASGQQAPNFASGTYWIAGGDSNCPGFCLNGNNASMTSVADGVTFLLTNGEGTGTFGTDSYASIVVTSGTLALCAPGTGCGTRCVTGGSCMLFVQNPAAAASIAPTDHVNSFAGNGHRTLSGLLYLPRQTVALNGNGPIDGCFGVISKFLDVGGTPEFSNGCLPGNGIGGGTTTTTVFANPRLSQ